jgi:MFS family permease
MKKSQLSLLRSGFYWSLPCLFFAFQFILRLWPGLVMDPLKKQFSLDSAEFGVLAAIYYYGYAGLQIPMAILLESWGVRRIVALCACVTGLGMFVLTFSETYALALLGRFLIGAGSAAAFLGTSKVISEWFAEASYARMVGFSFSLGLLGAIYGGKPVGLCIELFHWKRVGFVLSLVSVGIGFLVFFGLKGLDVKQSPYKKNAKKFDLEGLRQVFGARELWLLGLANFLMVGSLEGFADIWGVAFLTKGYGMFKPDAAGMMSLIYFGMLFGGPLLAWFSKRFGFYSVIGASALGLASLMSFLLAYQFSLSSLVVALFMLGLLCCYQVIVFEAGAAFSRPENLGLTVAFLNCMNMLGGSFFHTLIGRLVKLFQGSGFDYPELAAYKSAFSVIPFCACMGAVIVMVLKRSQRQEKEPVSVSDDADLLGSF